MPHTLRIFLVLLLLPLLGCQGEHKTSQNGGTGSSTAGSGDTSSPGNQPGNATSPGQTSGTGSTQPSAPTSPTWDTTDCAIPQPGLQYTRRITRREYTQSLRWFFDTMSDTHQYGFFYGRGGREISYPRDEEVQGLDNNVGAQAPESGRTMEYLLAAERIATVIKSYPDLYGAMMPCFRGDDSEAEFQRTAPSCLEAFIKKGAPLLWGKPLIADDLQDLKTSYAKAHDILSALTPRPEQKTIATESLAAVIETMLMSPKFLYRVELGSDDIAKGGARKLSDIEIASRLAVLMWGRGPDAALQQAAEAGDLHTPEQVRAQVDRIWQTEEGRYGIQNFLYQWLDLSGASKGRKFDLYDSGDKERGLDLEGKNTQELTRLVDHFLDAQSAPTLATLLTSTQTVLHDDLAKLYGLEPMGTKEFYVTDLDPTQRSGILTRASWMLSQSQSRAVSPTFRGLFIMNRLLCNTLPSPPATLNTNVGGDKRLSPRESFETKVTKNPDCTACHTKFDYFGYALDSYDYYGRWRTTYKDYNSEGDDFPIDTKVSVTVDDKEHQIDGAIELMEVLGQSQQVRQCAIHHWFAYTMGRTPDVNWSAKKGGDYCTMTSLQDTFEQSGGDLRDLLTATVLSDAFLYLSPSLTTQEN